MLPKTTERVRRNTAQEINLELERDSRQNLARFTTSGPDSIARRIEQLDEEWNIERALEANAAVAMLVGLGLGITVSRKLLVIPAIVGGFLLQHALQGWCPPVPIMRRLGFRTPSEIAREKYALKAIRGDFRAVPAGVNGGPIAEQAWDAAG
jgi:hypothetical protein